ncbi:unnamed protein product [Microthlaspi erraticum]|uniref:Reverse transcriptase domain-containing protein n=1 Tax=Microthlaspi erraticum TaxID=1685480 RepID=A0A6D2K6U3_9BRAS|nr:unnamed protein product [Microthlaspi erraticum]
MPPTLLQQANEEYDQLVSQGIVSSTNSPWACKAFYVNNRAEQTRGKLILVIDYKPLNQYLQDIKFSLPNNISKALLQHLQGATIFPKFDLKSGFWQLSDAKNLQASPQHRIDIHRRHTPILLKLRRSYSVPQMIIAQPNIDFLGMQITMGQVKPQSHLATALLDFPDENLTRRQVQQFPGVFWSILEHMGHEEHGGTWHGRSSTGYAKEEGEAILKTSSTTYSTNRSSSSTRPAKLQLDRAEKSKSNPKNVASPLTFL